MYGCYIPLKKWIGKTVSLKDSDYLQILLKVLSVHNTLNSNFTWEWSRIEIMKKMWHYLWIPSKRKKYQKIWKRYQKLCCPIYLVQYKCEIVSGLNQYLPTCHIPSEVCKSGGEPAVYLLHFQLTLGGVKNRLNKDSVNIQFLMETEWNFVCLWV